VRRGLGMRVLAWVLAVGLASPAWAAGPLEVDHPRVAEGRAAYRAGRYEEALSAFDAAKRERPDDPAVEFNRAVTLAKIGRIAEAKESFKRVTDSKRPELQEKAWYNLGNIHAETGERKEALQAYRRALKLDPNDELARHNYEVVLRNLPPPQEDAPDAGTDGGQSGQDGGRPDAGQDGGQKGDGGTPQDGGMDGGVDGGAGGDGGADGGADGGQGDGGSDGGADGGQQGQGDGGSDAGSDGGADEGEGEGRDGGMDGGTGEPEEQTEYEVDAGVSPEDIDRQEAERLLDAMKQNEKNLQLWRFQQKKKQRKPNEKDW
jgi:hypothetical protein